MDFTCGQPVQVESGGMILVTKSHPMVFDSRHLMTDFSPLRTLANIFQVTDFMRSIAKTKLTKINCLFISTPHYQF